MSEQVLNVLKFTLLGLVYLFFLRVLWAVWSEVRTPRRGHVIQPQRVTPSAMQPGAGGGSATAPMQRSTAAPDVATSASRQRRPPKGSRGRAARLVILEPRHRRGTAIALTGEITLGRDETCTISIQDDSYVSQLHLRVYDYDGQPMVEDLGSTNGTFHNGNRLHGSRVLHQGDRIQVGTTVIEAQ